MSDQLNKVNYRIFHNNHSQRSVAYASSAHNVATNFKIKPISFVEAAGIRGCEEKRNNEYVMILN